MVLSLKQIPFAFSKIENGGRSKRDSYFFIVIWDPA